jgi:hypothetical protein
VHDDRAGSDLACRLGMTWLLWLMIAACVAAFAAITGIKPRDTRPVAGTHLMSVARVILIFIVAILLWFAVKGT